MDSDTISKLLHNNHITSALFIGCYLNSNLNYDALLSSTNAFCIVNTLSSPKGMGHWICLYIKNSKLIFIDSFANQPELYGDDISDFFLSYPHRRMQLFNRAVQAPNSMICGGYVCVLAYMLALIFYHFRRDLPRHWTGISDKRDHHNVTSTPL